MLEKIRTACAVLMLALNITGILLLIHYNSALIQKRQAYEDNSGTCSDTR